MAWIRILGGAPQANFQAANEETPPDLMNILDNTFAGREQFAAEARKLFEDTDVCLRVEGFDLNQSRPPFAAARVIQVTLPTDDKDREAVSRQQRAYRGGAVLWPQWERCVYTQRCRKENGKCKLHLITDGPRSFSQ